MNKLLFYVASSAMVFCYNTMICMNICLVNSTSVVPQSNIKIIQGRSFVGGTQFPIPCVVNNFKVPQAQTFHKKTPPKHKDAFSVQDKAHIISDKIDSELLGSDLTLSCTKVLQLLSKSIVRDYDDKEIEEIIKNFNKHVGTVKDQNVLDALMQKNKFFNAVVKRFIEAHHTAFYNQIRTESYKSQTFSFLSPTFNDYLAHQVVTMDGHRFVNVKDAQEFYALFNTKIPVVREEQLSKIVLLMAVFYLTVVFNVP